MDLGNLVYIVAVIAYFIYQATKKKKQEIPDLTEVENEKKSSQPTTFEDLMREIREAQAPKKPSRPIAVEKPPVKEIPSRVERSVPKKWYEQEDDEISYYDGAFEKSKSLAAKPVSVPQLNFSDPTKKVYSKRESNENRYAKLLKDPQSIKDAVIISEILNRKHF